MNTISVVIPCYNAEKYIAECIHSVMNQSYLPIEIICINDGSTDRTLPLLKQLQEKYPCLIVIDSENKGASKARNVGLAIAKGDIIQFLDADDMIASDKFEKQIKCFAADVDMIVSDWVEMDSKLDRVLATTNFREIEQNPLETVIKKIVITGNPLYKTRVAKAIGGYNEHLKSAQDWDFHIRLVLANCRIKYVPGEYFIHRSVQGSISSNWVKVSIQAAEVIVDLKKKLEASVYMNHQIRQYLSQIYIDSAIYAPDKETRGKYTNELLFWSQGNYSFIKNQQKRLAIKVLGIKPIIYLQRLYFSTVQSKGN